MSENRYAPKRGGDDGGATQIGEHLSNMTTDELIDEMTDKWDAMDDEHFNPQIIDSYLAALDDRDPEAPEYNAEASLSAFREKHVILFDQMESTAIPSDLTPPARRFRRWRVLRIIAATLVVMFACMITAQAFGFDVFGTIARWTDEIFHFSSTAQTDDQVSSAPIGSEYSNLKEALRAYGITELIAPNWYPSKFQLSSIKVTPIPESIKIQAAYEDGERFISVTVWQMESAEEASNRIVEKDNRDVVLYESNGIGHYIMTNNAQTTVAWTNKNYMCSISGDLSVDEAKRIIDSIYER
jgi:hypothetical protein